MMRARSISIKVGHSFASIADSTCDTVCPPAMQLPGQMAARDLTSPFTIPVDLPVLQHPTDILGSRRPRIGGTPIVHQAIRRECETGTTTQTTFSSPTIEATRGRRFPRPYECPRTRSYSSQTTRRPSCRLSTSNCATSRRLGGRRATMTTSIPCHPCPRATSTPTPIPKHKRNGRGVSSSYSCC